MTTAWSAYVFGLLTKRWSGNFHLLLRTLHPFLATARTSVFHCYLASRRRLLHGAAIGTRGLLCDVSADRMIKVSHNNAAGIQLQFAVGKIGVNVTRNGDGVGTLGSFVLAGNLTLELV